MKQWIAAAFALCLLGGGAALAESTVITAETAVKEATTIVLAEVPEQYRVVIPPTMEIEYGRTAGKELPITVTECRLLPEHQLKVAATDYRSALVNGDASLAYTLENPENADSAPVLYFPSGISGDQAKSLIVTVTGDWNTAVAGEYADSVTFTVSIVEE